MGLPCSESLPGQEEGQAPPQPCPGIGPLAAKKKGDRVSWVQLQGDQVGDLQVSWVSDDGFPRLDQVSEVTVVQRYWEQGESRGEGP